MLLPATIQRPREGTKLLAVWHHVDRARCSLLMTLAVTRSQNLRVQAASSTGANTEGSVNAKALCSVQVVQQHGQQEKCTSRYCIKLFLQIMPNFNASNVISGPTVSNQSANHAVWFRATQETCKKLGETVRQPAVSRSATVTRKRKNLVSSTFTCICVTVAILVLALCRKSRFCVPCTHSPAPNIASSHELFGEHLLPC